MAVPTCVSSGHSRSPVSTPVVEHLVGLVVASVAVEAVDVVRPAPEHHRVVVASVVVALVVPITRV